MILDHSAFTTKLAAHRIYVEFIQESIFFNYLFHANKKITEFRVQLWTGIEPIGKGHFLVGTCPQWWWSLHGADVSRFIFIRKDCPCPIPRSECSSRRCLYQRFENSYRRRFTDRDGFGTYKTSEDPFPSLTFTYPSVTRSKVWIKVEIFLIR